MALVQTNITDKDTLKRKTKQNKKHFVQNIRVKYLLKILPIKNKWTSSVWLHEIKKVQLYNQPVCFV